MAGSNGLPKYAMVDRENELYQDVKFRGSIYYTPLPTLPAALTGGVMPPQSLLQAVYMDATTPNALTGPTTAQLSPFLQQEYLTTPNASWQTLYENSDPTNAKTINLGAGFTPSSFSIPAGTSALVGFQV